MITPQYTYDNSGKKIGVFLAIDDWNELIQLPGVEEAAQNELPVPDWHMELGIKELENVANGTADLMTWADSKATLKF